MNYNEMINDYLDAERKDITDKTRSAEKKIITFCVDFLTQHGYSAPTEDFFSALETKLLLDGNEGKPYAQTTVNKKLMPPVRKFFAWTEKKEDASEKGYAPLTSDKEAKTDNTRDFTEIKQPLVMYERMQNKGGRPRKTDPQTGEDYSEKITVYLSPSLEEDVKMLAEAQNTNINGYIRELVIADRNAKRDRIQALHGVKDAYEKSRAAYLEALRKL